MEEIEKHLKNALNLVAPWSSAQPKNEDRPHTMERDNNMPNNQFRNTTTSTYSPKMHSVSMVRDTSYSSSSYPNTQDIQSSFPKQTIFTSSNTPFSSNNKSNNNNSSAQPTPSTRDIEEISQENQDLIRQLARATLQMAGTRNSFEHSGVWTVEGFGDGQSVHVKPSRTVVDVVIRHCAGANSVVEVSVKGFCNSIIVEGCVNVRVVCDGVIEKCTVSNSELVDFYIGGFAPPFKLDTCDSIAIHMCVGTLIGQDLETRGCSNVCLFSAPTRNGIGLSAAEIMARPRPPPLILPQATINKVNKDGIVTCSKTPLKSASSNGLYQTRPVANYWNKSIQPLTSGFQPALPAVDNGEDVRRYQQMERNQQMEPEPPPADKPLVLSESQRAALPFLARTDHFYVAANEDELTFEDNEPVTILSEDAETGWVYGEIHGQRGLVPLTHVQLPKYLPVNSSKNAHTEFDRTLAEVRSVVDRVHSTYREEESKPPLLPLQQPLQQQQQQQQQISPSNAMKPTSPSVSQPAVSPKSNVPKLGLEVLPVAVLHPSVAGEASSLREETEKRDLSTEETGLILTEEKRAMMPFFAEAAFDYDANDSDELSFKVGDRIQIMRETPDEGWVVGQLLGRLGAVPLTHLSNNIVRRGLESKSGTMTTVQLVQAETAKGLTFTPEQARMFPMDVPARWDYEAREQDELSFREGDILRILEPFEDEGWVVAEKDGKKGLAPCPYLTAMFKTPLDPQSALQPQFNGSANDGDPKKAATSQVSPKKDRGAVSLEEAARRAAEERAKQEREEAEAEEEVRRQAAEAQRQAEKEAAERAKAAEAAIQMQKAAADLYNKQTDNSSGLIMNDERAQQLPAMCVAAWNFDGNGDDELTFREGDALLLVSMSADEGWMHAELKGRKGLVPCTHLTNKLIPRPGQGALSKSSTTTPVATPMMQPQAVVQAQTPPMPAVLEPEGAGLDLTREQIAQLPLFVRAEFDYDATAEDELTFRENDVLKILRVSQDDGWVEAEQDGGRHGLAPCTHMSKLALKSKQEWGSYPPVGVASQQPQSAVEVEKDRAKVEQLAHAQAAEAKALAAQAKAAAELAAKTEKTAQELSKEIMQQQQPAQSVPQAVSTAPVPLQITPAMAKTLPQNVTAAWDFDTQDPEELSFKCNDVVTILSLDDDEGWARGELRGKRGLVPLSYFHAKLSPPPKNEVVASSTQPIAPSVNQTAAHGATALAMQPLVQRAVAEWDYDGVDDEELTFKTGDVITVLRPSEDDGWFYAELNGKQGLVPETHIKMMLPEV